MVDFALVVPPVHDNPVEHRRMLAMRANNSFPKTGSESMQAPLRLKVFEEGNEPDPSLWEGSVIYTDAGNVKFSDGSIWIDFVGDPVELSQIEDIGANTVLCRPSGVDGPVIELLMGNHTVLARGSGNIVPLFASNGTVLRRSVSGVTGFGQLETEHLGDDIVTLAKLAADVYQSAVVELGGDFTGGEEVKFVRTGDEVTITGVGANLAHTSSATPASGATIVPADFRPTHPSGSPYAFLAGSTTLCSISVLDTGQLILAYRDSSDGSNVARTNSAIPPVITYNIT